MTEHGAALCSFRSWSPGVDRGLLRPRRRLRLSGSASITLKVYAHVLRELAAGVADVFANAIESA